jgi:hypothetical protein
MEVVLNETDDPEHKAPVVYVKSAAEPFTVIFLVATHPFESVYVIVTLPAEIPVTKPELSTVAIPLFDEVHGLVVAGVPLPLRFNVEPAQIELVFGVIDGKGFTVNKTELSHPLLLL